MIPSGTKLARENPRPGSPEVQGLWCSFKFTGFRRLLFILRDVVTISRVALAKGANNLRRKCKGIMKILCQTLSLSWIRSGAAILFFGFALPALAQSATPQSPAPAIGPIVRQSLHHDVSPALRDLPATSQSQLNTVEAQEAEPVRRIPWSPILKTPLQADSVLQSTAAAPSPEVAISVNNNFEGLGDQQYTFTVRGAPPDTNGAAGLTQYVQWVNTSFAVFDKSTGNLVLGPLVGKQLWAGFGGACETNNNGDPIVVYDKIANRWVLSQFSVSGGPPFFQSLAASPSPAPTPSH